MSINKIIILMSIVLFSHSVSFSQNSGIFLQWKIAKGDTLKYQTIMNAEQSFAEETSKADTSTNVFKNLFKSINKANGNMKYQTNIFLNQKDNNLIDIEMKTVASTDTAHKSPMKQDFEGTKNKKKDKKQTDEKSDSLAVQNMFNALSGMGSMVVLRGRITPGGEMVSNYYKNSQRNLVSILFALPNKPVQIGEKWKLAASFIEMDQNFYADSSSNINDVYIEKIIEKDNDKIAIIKYNILEYVSGDFIAQMIKLPGMDNNKKTFMKYSYSATGYFSMTKGKWLNYEGESEVDTNFSMIGGKTKQIFKLIE